MVMALVRAFAAIGLGELDAVAYNAINGPNLHAIRSNNLGMFLDIAEMRHGMAPFFTMKQKECAKSDLVPSPA
jgi:hypothetical protein